MFTSLLGGGLTDTSITDPLSGGGLGFVSFFTSGLTSIFANGIVSSCFNSTEHLRPTFVTNAIQTILKPKTQPFLDVLNNPNSTPAQYQSALNSLSDQAEFFYGYFRNWKHSKDWSSCSKAGLNLYLDYAILLRNTVQNAVNNCPHEILSTETIQTTAVGRRTPQDDATITQMLTTFSYTKYNLKSTITDSISTTTTEVLANASSNPLMWLLMIGMSIPLIASLFKGDKKKKTVSTRYIKRT